MEETKALVVFYSNDGKYSIPEAPIMIPATLKRTGMSEIVNSILELEKKVEFEFIIEGKFLKSSLQHYLDANSLSTVMHNLS
jgi:ribosome biogenesis protein YTM1